MRRCYFYHNGKQYDAGTIVVIADKDKNNNAVIKEVVFEFCIQETKDYVYNDNGRKRLKTEAQFKNMLIEITDRHDSSVQIPIKKYKKDAEIPKLFIGWIWYILIMCIAFIFYDRFGIWVISSIVFFNWRRKVKEEKGVYYER